MNAGLSRGFMSEAVATSRDRSKNTGCAECGKPNDLKLCSGKASDSAHLFSASCCVAVAAAAAQMQQLHKIALAGQHVQHHCYAAQSVLAVR